MPLNILIVSTQLFCKRLQLALREPAERLCQGDVVIKVTDSAEYLRTWIASLETQTLTDIEKKTVDYVFVVLDGTQLGNDIKYHSVLENLMSHYAATRVALVNGSCRSARPSLVVAARTMTDLADNFNIPYLNAEITDDENCRRTAERMLRMAMIASGYQFGPPIPIPTVVDLGLQPPIVEPTETSIHPC